METGVASVCLPEIWRQRHESCFDSARWALNFASQTVRESTDILPFPRITSEMDSAYATGYHLAGVDLHTDSKSTSMSRYNAYREGFIFSNGELFTIGITDTSFYPSMSTLFHSMHDDIACPILEAIATYLDLTDVDWFQSTLGPTALHSQWHLKRFVHPVSSSTTTATNERNNGDDSMEWLPSHTDPSLISVVIHDAPYIAPGGMGLQYQLRPCTTTTTLNTKNETTTSTQNTTTSTNNILWKEIPRHGHGVATIFVGSILSFITGNVLFPSAKHRVVYNPQDDYPNRIAATLFVRPRGDAILVSPPSHRLVIDDDPSFQRKEKIIFSHWLKKVSRNYMKSKKR